MAHDESGTLNRPVSRRRLVELGALGALAATLPVGGTARAAIAATPKRGGRFRVGMVGGGTKETLDPQNQLVEIDVARAALLYENLFDYDARGRVVPVLAAGYSANKQATVWKIRVAPGVLFHDGKPLTAADVVYSLRRITDPKNKIPGAADLPSLKPSGVRALDKTTVELRLTSPTGNLPGALAQRYMRIVRAGWTNFDKPNGTGPFRFKSFTRGQRSLFVRHPSYRKHNGPYLAEVEVISIDDQTARFNALSAGQVDAMQLLPPAFVKSVQGNSKLRVLQSPSGAFTPLTMAVDLDPFTDVRVRQAFKYAIDRNQIVQQALLGYGRVGNDLFCPNDEDFASSLPQRTYDPERAKSLLKAAGKEGLNVTLDTSDVATAAVESSTLFAQQAKAAGINVTVNKIPSDQYFGDRYLKYAFGVSGWGQRSLEAQILQSVDGKAVYNETHFKNPTFDKLTAEARRSTDPKRRKVLNLEAQRILYNQGGFIIWGFPNQLDAYSAKVKGLKPSSARALGFYHFEDVYFA